MSEAQKFQLVKGKRDAILDLASLGVFLGMAYFALNPDKYDRVTDAVSTRIRKIENWLSVMQTKMSIRSLPETDE
jgi:hypothetical protein